MSLDRKPSHCPIKSIFPHSFHFFRVFQQINPIKVITIYDAVECLKVPDNKNILEEDASSGKQLVGIFGTIQPGKGQIDAVNAIKELVKKGVKVHLAIVGEPDPDLFC